MISFAEFEIALKGLARLVRQRRGREGLTVLAVDVELWSGWAAGGW